MSEIQVGDKVQLTQKIDEADVPYAPVGARGRIIRVADMEPRYLVEFEEYAQEYCFRGEIEVISEAEAIRIWPWQSAPQCFKENIEVGGKKTWLAFIPQDLYKNRGWWPTCLVEAYLNGRLYRSKARDGWVAI